MGKARENEALLDIRRLSIGLPKGNKSFAAVCGMQFQIQEGEILGVVGESGSGKSMIALAIMGLLPKEARILNGEICFRGEDLLEMKAEARRKLTGSEIAMVFQEPMTSLNPVMRIGKQVEESLRLHTDLTGRELHEKVIWALTEAELPDPEELCKKYPHELSGGMRQRVMLAQALVCSPSLIIADEPTTALDVILQAQILKLLKRIHKEHNTSILFISHDLNVVRELCSRVLVVYEGQLVEEGDVRQVLYEPRHAYTRRLVASIPEAKPLEQSGREILRLENLDVFYDIDSGLFRKKGKKHVIHDVSLTACEGEILGIVGESGCGKSTLCKTILGLHSQYSGSVWVEEGSRPQMVFQDPFSSLNPARRIGWILEEPLRLRGIRDKETRKEMVDQMLLDIGLDPSFAGRRVRELSGGQRQRISIGAALLMDSRLLIADEPVSALDVTVQSQILNLLLALHGKRRMTMLFISHDLNIIRRICRRVAVIYKGEIVEEGLSEDIYNAPAHPYTRLLLDAIVGSGPERERKEARERKEREEEKAEEAGLKKPADAGERLPDGFSGCAFYPRCPRRSDACKEGRAPLFDFGNGHVARCVDACRAAGM
ncbi:ABC transporter ATP-binding protein [Clostridiaceae bacterium]|nr:ABC transporter ATP-binding protein [Clostridium sp.]NBI71088.1 ABC transporter ATP-binding protein [Clostridiaceae bacterium]